MNTAGTFCYFLSVFLSAHLTTMVNNTIGIAGSFFVFMIINGIVFLVAFFFVPETEGLTYEQYVKKDMDEKNREQDPLLLESG